MDVWWFPTISYVKIGFIIQLKQPFINGWPWGFQGAIKQTPLSFKCQRVNSTRFTAKNIGRFLVAGRRKVSVWNTLPFHGVFRDDLDTVTRVHWRPKVFTIVVIFGVFGFLRMYYPLARGTRNHCESGWASGCFLGVAKKRPRWKFRASRQSVLRIAYRDTGNILEVLFLGICVFLLQWLLVLATDSTTKQITTRLG